MVSGDGGTRKPSSRSRVIVARTASKSSTVRPGVNSNVTLGVTLLLTPGRTVEDLDAVLATMTRERDDGFLVPPSPLTISKPVNLVELAFHNLMPIKHVTSDIII